MSNLDPALGGPPTRPFQSERLGASSSTSPNVTTEPYRSDGAGSTRSYSSSTLPTPHSYYQYTNPQLHSHIGPSGDSQERPAGPSFVPQNAPVSPQEDQSNNDAAAQEEAKRPRACESCRTLKVRCDQDPLRPEIPCRRCAKAGRPCVITQPSRKRQKKTDSRVAELEKKLEGVAELEKKLEGVQSELRALKGAEDPRQMPAASEQPRSTAIHTASIDHGGEQRATQKRCDSIYTATQNGKRRRMSVAHEGQLGENVRTRFHVTNPHTLRAKINELVPFHQSSDLFRRYNDSMASWLPMVVFSRNTTPEQVFEDRPILYLAIITAASGSGILPDKQEALQREVMGVIADCVVRDGEKSLELIQAMLIMTGWYRPPERAEQTNFYQVLHMAAVMALDIGLGRRAYLKKQRTPFGEKEVAFSIRSSYTNSDTLEARRAWLGCYYLCATASMVLRRPNLVRWTEYMKECIEVLETCPQAHVNDRLLCQHIKIQHICEDVGLQFLMDDSTAQININDPKVTYALVTLENKLKEWREKVPADVQCPSLTFFEHVTSLYLHEIALHFNHNIEDFRLPFTEESLRNVDSSPDALTQAQVSAIEACQKAAHGILDTMIHFSLDELLALPLLLYFVRCVYALVILIKMYVAIGTPGSELGKLMKSADLKIEYYMDEMICNFEKIGAQHILSEKPNKALSILTYFRKWFQKYKEGGVKTDTRPQPGQRSTEDTSQTPLHMLSQVATGQQDTIARPEDHSDWTMPYPNIIRHPQFSNGNVLTPGYGASGQQSTSELSSNTTAFTPGILNMMEGMNNGLDGFPWGSGFEQAMDMTLGHLTHWFPDASDSGSTQF